MMNGSREQHEDQPVASAEAPESDFARSPTAQPDMHIARCSLTPESDSLFESPSTMEPDVPLAEPLSAVVPVALLADSPLSMEPVVTLVESPSALEPCMPHLEPISALESGMLLAESPPTLEPGVPLAESPLGLKLDSVSGDALDVCNALLDAVEQHTQTAKSPSLPTVQISKMPSVTEVSSLPDADVSHIPPDLPVPDCQECSGTEAADLVVLQDSVLSVIEYVVACAIVPQKTPLCLDTLPCQETSLVNRDVARTLSMLSNRETSCSQEILSCHELPEIRDVQRSQDTLPSVKLSPNRSRFGRVRKRRRLSPPDSPVKKQKVVLRMSELGLIPAPVKKKKVVFKVTKLGLFPTFDKKLNVKNKAGTTKPDPIPDKNLKPKNKVTKPELATMPVKKLKATHKVAKQGPILDVAQGLPSPVKTAKVKSKAVKPVTASTPIKKPKGEKSDTSLTIDSPTCRDIKNKWNPGDVVWFKVVKEPYWPGKVIRDYETGEFKRVRSGMNEYCLLPFGQDASCKWVLAPMMLKFDGRQQFEEHKQSLLDKHPEDSPTRAIIKTKFGVNDSKLEEWSKVVQDAEICHLNGSHETIKELGAKMASETETSLTNQEAAKNSMKMAAMGNSVLVPKKRSQKRKKQASEPAMMAQPDTPKKKRQKKQKMDVSTVSQVDEVGVTCKKKKSKTMKATVPHEGVVPKRAVKKKKQPKAVLGKFHETSELNDSCNSVESTIQAVIDFGEQCSLLQAAETVTEKEVINSKTKKKRASAKTKNILLGNNSKEPITPDDSRSKKTGKKNRVQGVSPCRSSKERVKTSPLKRFLNETHSGDSDSGSSAKKDILPPEGKNEKVCQACEQIIPSSDGVRCIGNCNSIFHASCTKPAEPSAKDGTYKCEECTSGIHSCFVCKRNNDVEVRRCSIRLCGKFYHPACLDTYRTARIDGDHITCSLHSCMSCALNFCATNGKKGRMVRCLRCPVAYHFTEDCLAAGSLIISHSSIVCPKHYEPKKMAKVMHVNVNWCFVCSNGGSLICCESCPASFHAECLGIVPPEGSYYCAECLAGTQPKYGYIVWVKLGNYRWWPAKIINPRNAPSNIRNMPHQVGEFPVCFFGTHDYYWTTRSRVFQFLEGDQGAHDNTANRLAKRYEKALNEACVAYHEWKIAKECRAAQDYEKNSLIPPRYKPIKVNRPVGRVSMTTADPSQMTPCDCDPNSENPCGSDSECLNRMLMFECHPSVCAAGEKCQNQRFEKRQYKPAEIFRAEGKGWGLKSLVDIRKGEFVNEYIGEIIDEMECRLRMKRMHEENNTNYYFLTIDKDRIIDAARKGNLSRFMNHSCQPNCETHKWTVNGNTRVGLFAVCDIPEGTELTFNYNLDCLGNNKTTCRCEAPNCSGFIGERPKRANQIKSCQKENDKAAGMKKKKRKKTAVKCEHEDECFRCGHDGELLMCDRKNCPKAYHLNCLNLEKPPHGRWECPWHHCDICGKVSSSLCLICPNSYCKEHSGGNIKIHEDGLTYCADHVTEDEAIHRAVINRPQHSIDVEEARSTVTQIPEVESAVFSLKPCEQAKVLPAEKQEPVLVPNMKRQRMIAEKLKIKLNGSKKHGYPTCKRIRVTSKKVKLKPVKEKTKKVQTSVSMAALSGKTAKGPQLPNGALKPHKSVATMKIKSVNGSAAPVNGLTKCCKVKTTLGSKCTKKKSAPKTALVTKVNGKTIGIATKKKGARQATAGVCCKPDRSESVVERTEKSAPLVLPTAVALLALPKVAELSSHLT